ncbi:hypothetical protein N878_26900 [Pseudomonas sp. EGD-AK9]|nr:hypothetical protein N878_26900 [Pseudomonas sp. EGD-AK9]
MLDIFHWLLFSVGQCYILLSQVFYYHFVSINFCSMFFFYHLKGGFSFFAIRLKLFFYFFYNQPFLPFDFLF